MITLLGSLIGFVSAAFPELLKLFQDKQDRKHELAVLDRQMQLRFEERSERLDAISQTIGAEQMKALYHTYKTDIRWVDALNGTVRPVLAYAFFMLYAVVKGWQVYLATDASIPLSVMASVLWGQEDQAIFAGIISFYYGQRAMAKRFGQSGR